MLNRSDLEYDLNAMVRHIDQLIEQHGFTQETLGWTKEKQPLRFQVLTDIGVQRNSKILDFGCGLADLYAYCGKKFNSIEYIGIDIHPQLVAESKRRYPEADVRCIDIFEQRPVEQVDYVIISGTFNYPFKKIDNYEFIAATLTELFSLCRCGIAVDFFSTYVDFKTDALFYSDPLRIFEIAGSLSRRVTLRHDYFPFEFCVYIYKDDSVNERYVFQQFEESSSCRE